MLIMGIITITAGVLALAFPETVNETVINHILLQLLQNYILMHFGPKNFWNRRMYKCW